MSLKRLAIAALSLVLSVSVLPARAAQEPSADVPFPQIYWQLGNVSGLNMKRGQVVDGFLRYYVRVPEGTAASYAVNVDFCEWAPIQGNIPREGKECFSADPLLVSDLTEIEPGRLYEGQFYYSLEQGDLTFKRVNRLSFALNLRQIDHGDPSQVLATQELNLIVFAGLKGKVE